MQRAFVIVFGMALLLTACSTATPATPRTDGSDTASERPAVIPSAAASEPAPDASSAPSATGDPLLDLELVDVRTGTAFTLGQLAADGPVLVETMAIWCSNCRAQQREVVAAHELADFSSVGIDVEPNERATELAEYAQREGFDWRFAIASSELVRLLTDRYGFAVTNPPSTPTFVISPVGEIRALEFNRHRSAAELVAELNAG